MLSPITYSEVNMLSTTPKMTAEEFKQGLARLKWKPADFALATGTNQTTVSNWAAGNYAIPNWAQTHLNLLLKLADISDALLTPPAKAARAAKRQSKKVL